MDAIFLGLGALLWVLLAALARASRALEQRP